MVSLSGRDIIATEDLSKDEILHLLSWADKLEKESRPDLLKDKILGSCFFEPSTRTRLSFESAMLRLGGKTLGFADQKATSVQKGESLYDTMKAIENYVDVLVIRHPLEGAAQWAADAVEIPVLNAGDGANEHPTQTLLDLYSILQTQGRLEKLDIALAGDLKHGRTAHSLARALKHFNARLFLVAPLPLEMPRNVCNALKENGIKFSFHREIEEVINKVDIFYMTRIQEERFADSNEYKMVSKVYSIGPKHLDKVRSNLKILHPLPRLHEIDRKVDSMPYAHYFQQAKKGLFVRQAILGLVLGKL